MLCTGSVLRRGAVGRKGTDFRVRIGRLVYMSQTSPHLHGEGRQSGIRIASPLWSDLRNPATATNICSALAGCGCCAVSPVSLNPHIDDGIPSILILEVRKLRHKEIMEWPEGMQLACGE